MLSGGPDAPRERQPRILVADDNEINQMVAVEMLRSVGWEAEVASNGQQAVEAAKTGRFDLVLMDCQMPGMDGLEATRLLRAEEAAGAPLRRGGGVLTIIALTARAVVGDQQKCTDAGMTGYFTKPVKRPLLLSTIARILKIQAPSLTSASLSWAETSPRTTTAMPAADAIDVVELTDRCGGHSAFVADLLSTFVCSARERVAQLAASIDQGLHADVPQLAHSLKGTAANVAALSLSEAVEGLEMAAHAQQVAQYAPLQRQIEREFTRCEEAINALLAGLEARDCEPADAQL